MLAVVPEGREKVKAGVGRQESGPEPWEEGGKKYLGMASFCCFPRRGHIISGKTRPHPSPSRLTYWKEPEVNWAQELPTHLAVGEPLCKDATRVPLSTLQRSPAVILSSPQPCHRAGPLQDALGGGRKDSGTHLVDKEITLPLPSLARV